MKSRFEFKLAGGFLITLAIFATLAAYTYFNNLKQLDTGRWVTHTNAVLFSSEQLLTTMLGSETGYRGFVLTGDQKFLDPYLKSEDSVRSRLARLKRLTHDSPSQQEKIGRLEIIIGKKIEWAQAVITARRASSKNAVNLVTTYQGKDLMDEIRAIVSDLQTTEMKLLIKREAENENQIAEFNNLFFATLATTTIILIAMFTMIVVNLQARTRSEAGLQKVSDEIKDLYNNAPCGYHSLDVNGIFVDINDTELRWIGYQREEVVGKLRVSDIFTPESKEKFKRKFLEFKQVGFLNDLEFEMIRKDGTVLPVMFSAIAIYDEQGNYLRSRSTVFDYTELKKAEERLKEFKHFFNNSNDLSCIANVQGYFEILNPNFEKVLGHSEKELRENQFLNFIHPDDIPATLQEIEKLKTGAITINFVNRYRKKDGDYLWFDWNSTPDPVTGKLYAIARDITERKKYEQELETITGKLEEAQAIAHVGNWDFDLITNKSTWSDEAFTIYGFDKKVTIPSTEAFLSHIHPEDLAFVKERIAASYATSKGDTFNCRIKRNDGTIVYTLIQSSLDSDEYGKPLRLYGTVQDITGLKRAEEKLKMVNEELESFTYSVSHDLRAPLRALEGFANALSEKYKGKFDEDANRWLDFVSTNAKRMDLLISDMLNFSRISKENVKGNSINMKVLAQECFESSKMNYPGKNITFTLENIPDSFGDVAMARQVWHNLILNALKYSSKNENITIAVTGKIENDFTVYAIKDNGVGFDEKYKNKLFRVFQRLHSNKEFEGTGVGLALVNRIIQKHNGWITASGQPGKGAEFIFALPIHRIIENNN